MSVTTAIYKLDINKRVRWLRNSLKTLENHCNRESNKDVMDEYDSLLLYQIESYIEAKELDSYT